MAIAREALSGETFHSWNVKQIWPYTDDGQLPEKNLATAFLRSLSGMQFSTMTSGTRFAVWQAVLVYMDLSAAEFPYPEDFFALDKAEIKARGRLKYGDFVAMRATRSRRQQRLFPLFAALGVVTVITMMLVVDSRGSPSNAGRQANLVPPAPVVMPPILALPPPEAIQEASAPPLLPAVPLWLGPASLPVDAASIYGDPKSGCEYLVFPSTSMFGGAPAVMERLGPGGVQAGCKEDAPFK